MSSPEDFAYSVSRYHLMTSALDFGRGGRFDFESFLVAAQSSLDVVVVDGGGGGRDGFTSSFLICIVSTSSRVVDNVTGLDIVGRVSSKRAGTVGFVALGIERRILLGEPLGDGFGLYEVLEFFIPPIQEAVAGSSLHDDFALLLLVEESSFFLIFSNSARSFSSFRILSNSL